MNLVISDKIDNKHIYEVEVKGFDGSFIFSRPSEKYFKRRFKQKHHKLNIDQLIIKPIKEIGETTLKL